MSSRLLFLVLISVLFCNTTYAVGSVDVTSGNKSYYNLKDKLEIFMGAEDDDPLSHENYVKYKPSLLDLGAEEHWFRVQINNEAMKSADLFISTFFLDSIVVYQKLSDTVELVSSNNGYLVPVFDRAHHFVQTSIIPLNVPATSSNYYYFQVINRTKSGRMAMKSSMRMGFLAYTSEGFDKWYGYGMSFNYFMAGMMLIIALLNFTLYLISKEKNYAYLSLNNLAYLVWIGVFSGALLYFKIVDDYELERSIRITVPTFLIALTYALYSLNFMDFRKHFPKMRIALLVLVWMHTAMMIPHSLGYHEVAIIVSEIISPLIYIPLLLCSYVHWRRGNKLSLYFFIASTFFNIGLIFYLYAYNSNHVNYLAGHFLAQLCFMLEVLTFSIITTQRFVNLRVSHTKAVMSKDLLEKELNNKNRQLTSMVAAQIRKSELLDSLRQKVVARVETPESRSLINKEIDGILKFDNSWEDFKLHFEEVHPSFFRSLRTQVDALTPNDERIAAFLKMGLKNKEIAVISGISVRGVEKAKERLKKKLHTENLYKEITSIG